MAVSFESLSLWKSKSVLCSTLETVSPVMMPSVSCSLSLGKRPSPLEFTSVASTTVAAGAIDNSSSATASVSYRRVPPMYHNYRGTNSPSPASSLRTVRPSLKWNQILATAIVRILNMVDNQALSFWGYAFNTLPKTSPVKYRCLILIGRIVIGAHLQNVLDRTSG